MPILFMPTTSSPEWLLDTSPEGELVVEPLPLPQPAPSNPFRLWVQGPIDDMPQRRIYLALHNDYTEDPEPTTELTEDQCGKIAVKRLLNGDRGHYGPLEHVHLTVLLQADHDTMMQLRTHRIASFDLQSNRYTGQRFMDVATGHRSVYKTFHFRPPGTYRDRQGDPYLWAASDNNSLATAYVNACESYLSLRDRGVAEEHARQVLPGSFLQHGTVTMNARAWLHVLDMRLKPDAQYEIRWAMELLKGAVKRWIPEIASWYETHRLGKGRLAP